MRPDSFTMQIKLDNQVLCTSSALNKLFLDLNFFGPIMHIISKNILIKQNCIFLS